MKREAVMMLTAGFLLGAVLSFMGTREYYKKRINNTQGPPAAASAAPAARSGSPSFDPAQHEAMLAAIKEDIRKHPDDVAKRAMLANIFYDAGKFGEAVPLYEEILRRTPKNTDIMVDLGVCYRRLGRVDDALGMFNRALKVDPEKKQALFNKVVVLGMDKGDRKGAETGLMKLRKQYPNEPAIDQLKHALQQKWSAEQPKGKNG